MTNKTIPVVFTHHGYPWVEIAIRQALLHNPRVVLLGDGQGVPTAGEYYSFADYASADAELFERSYVPLHYNPPFDIYVNKALFHVRDWMKQHDVQKIFICDSDLLLYSNVTEIASDWEGPETHVAQTIYQPEYRWAASMHESYWTCDTLDAFCNFVLEIYTTRSGLYRVQEKWNYHQRMGTRDNICIMTLLYLMCLDYPELFGESLLHPVGDPVHVFDQHISTSEGEVRDEYEVWAAPDVAYNVFKVFDWREHQPYVHNLTHKKWMKLDAIHCQGGAKRVMVNHVSPELALIAFKIWHPYMVCLNNAHNETRRLAAMEGMWKTLEKMDSI